MTDGRTWQGEFSFENELALCRRDDPWYSYALRLRSAGLYEQLIRLCVANEKSFHPHATPSNIILRTNLDLASYDPIDAGRPIGSKRPHGDATDLDSRP